MTFSSDDLIADLKSKTRELIKTAEQHFAELPSKSLNERPAPESWSIAECLEHLNLYAEYYHDMIDRKMSASNEAAHPKFRSGIIGNYFSNVMQVKNGRITKMSSPKDKNPIHSDIPEGIVERFIKRQKEMMELLDRAKSANLAKIRIPITIYPWLKLKLGDTFRFSVNHNERHVIQSMKVLEK